MGTYRMILAIAVTIAHITEIFGESALSRESTGILVWSGHAVFAFFIISGFYISMILNEKYHFDRLGISRFYVNRALRLYPAHWTILFLYALTFLATGTPSFLLGENFGEPILFSIAWFSNLTFLGVEWIPFFKVENWRFVIGPVWSLGVEIAFYLIAPLVVGLPLKKLLLITLIALAFRLGLYLEGVQLLPWRYFFFPANFVFFLLGAVSYRIYAVRDRIYGFKWLSLASATLLFFSAFYPPLWTVSDLDQPLSWLYFVIVFVTTPFVFHLFKDSRLDNFLGTLAYPIYISHMLAMTITQSFLPGVQDKGVAAFVISIVLSLLLYFAIDRPVERIRRAIVGRNYAIFSRWGQTKHLPQSGCLNNGVSNQEERVLTTATRTR